MNQNGILFEISSMSLQRLKMYHLRQYILLICPILMNLILNDLLLLYLTITCMNLKKSKRKLRKIFPMAGIVILVQFMYPKDSLQFLKPPGKMLTIFHYIEEEDLYLISEILLVDILNLQ